MKFLCKRGGSSGAGSRGSSRNASPSQQQQQQTTPSGVTYNQFMQMTPDERYDLINTILSNPNIQVPSYLDASETSKVMYALGMNNKPTVVSDSVLDSMPGRDRFRVVYDDSSPPPYATDILDQIKTSDYTHLSGSGGSAHGRAIYFADSFSSAAGYSRGDSSRAMRMKLKPNANIISENALTIQMYADRSFMNKSKTIFKDDRIAMYALSHGVDGWYDSNFGYTMMLNRGALNVSSINKQTIGIRPGRVRRNRFFYPDWTSAPNA